MEDIESGEKQDTSPDASWIGALEEPVKIHRRRRNCTDGSVLLHASSQWDQVSKAFIHDATQTRRLAVIRDARPYRHAGNLSIRIEASEPTSQRNARIIPNRRAHNQARKIIGSPVDQQPPAFKSSRTPCRPSRKPRNAIEKPHSRSH